MKIENKVDMYAMLNRGIFGNSFRIWDSIAEAEADGCDGPYGVRIMSTAWPAVGVLPKEDVVVFLQDANYVGVKVKLCDPVPNDKIILQIECCLSPDGLHIRYKEQAGHMKAAMRDPLYAKGTKAAGIIRRYMYESGYEWLMYLMETYDGATADVSAAIEVSVFTEPVGRLAQNYVIWEVRAY